MNSKLNLDQSKINLARSAAENIADGLHSWIGSYSTTSIERTVLRLLGIDGLDKSGVPLPNLLVDLAQESGLLPLGIAYLLGQAVLEYKCTPQELAEQVAAKKATFPLTATPDSTHLKANDDTVFREINRLAAQSMEKIRLRRQERTQLMSTLGIGATPLLYVIVATGNVYEDALQAQAAATQGADIVAVIRATGQSLLDYVPYGATTEGFGGTYATQENFRIVRQALDETGEKIGRYIQLVNYCSGLCMPEIAAMGAIERLDMMLNDSMYGILFRDINMKRTFIDQHFSRLLNAFAGIVINTGEDNYLTTSDAVEKAYTVLASQFINEQLGLKSGLKPAQLGLGHAFEIDPALEDSFLLEVAQAQMAREIFPDCPLKYMPPTKHITGNIFQGHLINGMFNLSTVMTDQGIILLGMLTEALHTPYMNERYLSIENARYVFQATRHLGEEIIFKEGGRIQTRAQQVLDETLSFLGEIKEIGLESAIEKGMFAEISRSRAGGKGGKGVILKSSRYYNPFFTLLSEEVRKNEQ